MTKKNTNQIRPEWPAPSERLQRLDRLIGVWEISGGAGGRISYEWMEGGYFLIQHVDLEQHDMRIKGMEIIGHERRFGEAPGEAIKSRFYDNLGNTLDYEYELDGDTLTIWAGERGSPAFYVGKFSEDGNALQGSWVYPDGGGYESNAVRIKSS